MSDAIESFGERVRKARTDTGMSQRAFADMAGVDRSALARLEAGERDPRLSEALTIASALGLQIGPVRSPSFLAYLTSIESIRNRIEQSRTSLRDAVARAIILEEQFNEEMEEEALRQMPGEGSIEEIFLNDLLSLPEQIEAGNSRRGNPTPILEDERHKVLAEVLTRAVVDRLFSGPNDEE